MKSKTLLMYSIIGAIIATAGALAVSGAVCEPDCIQSLSSLITGSQPLQQPQASPQQTPTANPTPSLSIGGSQTAEKSKPSGNSGGTFGSIILSSPKPLPSKQCNQFKETCYQYLQSGSQPAGQAYSDQQCQAKFGYAYHYDYRMNGCVPLGGSQPIQHAQGQPYQQQQNYQQQSAENNKINDLNQQCVTKFSWVKDIYYDVTKNACLPRSGSWANYSTHGDNNQQGSVGTSAPVDQNAQCREKFWWVKGIYYDATQNGCVPPGGWGAYKIVKYDPHWLAMTVDYTVDVSADALKADIEKSFSTSTPMDTRSRGLIPYDDSPGNMHTTANLWFFIQPTEGNNLYFVVHLDNATKDGKYCGNIQMDGKAVYHSDDATITGTKSIGELQKLC